MGFYIESSDRSLKSAVAGEDIKAGTLVEKQGDGTVTLVDNNSSTFDGVVEYVHREEAIADDDDDAFSQTYLAVEPDGLGGAALVPFGGDADGDVIKVRTLLDPEDGDDDAVSITDGTRVGVVQNADTDYHGRVVQEGYSDGTTTYDEATGNMIIVGKCLRDSADGYDQIIRVQVRK